MIGKRLLVATILLLISASASADWLKDYEAGLAAARKEQWQVVVQKMTAAIAARPNEGRERPYGTRFIEYRPYYYRGVAYFELGQFEQALADLSKTKGPGEVSLGAADSYISRAEQKMQAARPAVTTPTETAPPTTTVARERERVTPPPVEVDPAVQRTAEQHLAGARKASQAAQQANAETYAAAQFTRGTQTLLDAMNKRAAAETTEDWRAVSTAAERATREFESAASAAQVAAAATRTAPERAAEATVAPVRRRVREALEAYFDGDFRTAATRLELLTKEHQGNAMLWAFLGAAHYYSYYLDGAANQGSLASARKAFQRARKLNPGLQLNANYFSARVRNFYEKLAG